MAPSADTGPSLRSPKHQGSSSNGNDWWMSVDRMHQRLPCSNDTDGVRCLETTRSGRLYSSTQRQRRRWSTRRPSRLRQHWCWFADPKSRRSPEQLRRSFVFSTMLYGSETCTFTKRCESRILSFERKCYRKILRMGWAQKVTNEELYRHIQLAETLLQKVIQRKLRFFGHICRMDDSRKIKTLVIGMMDGSNKRGRLHREWSDNIEQWCGATLQELSHAALDRQRWAAIVTMTSDTNGCWTHGCRWWWWWWWCMSADPEEKRSLRQPRRRSEVDDRRW